MTQKKYNAMHALIQRLASSVPGSWFLSRTLHHLDGLFLRASRGRYNLTSILAGVPLVVVTTTGAKSGLPRSVPLLCIRDKNAPASFALIATNWGQQHYPAWYINLKANPHASCSVDGQVGRYLAHEASEAEYARFWQEAIDTYFGYLLYKQRIHGRKVPILVMEPLER
jgi:deazaflavin-dependent oxidoreductase (nitroreductase family)